MRSIARWTSLGAALAAATSALAPVASAQSARNSIERNRAAMCAKADADGDTYRPFVCDPRCDCITPAVEADLADADVCQGSVPGTVEARAVIPGGEPVCFGICYDQSGPTGTYCSTATGCPGAQGCVFSVPVDVRACGRAESVCSTDADCPVDFSCGTGGFCIYDGSFSCPSDAPSTPQVCGPSLPPTFETIVRLVGVDVADGPGAVACETREGTSGINANDALACRDRIESITGLDCP